MENFSNEEKSYLIDHCFHKLLVYKYHLDLNTLSESGLKFVEYRRELLNSIIKKLKS